MRVHFIAIGGSAMHNLALALQKKGYHVSGSDDEIFDPAKSRLQKAGLLPAIGWFPEKITPQLDAVILGMHARIDNPELVRAKELGLKIFSYPEYLYEQSKNKTRIVIGGSHGKTSITAMIIHVLQSCGIDTDYMVGAQLEGFDIMVKLTDAPYIILEGDEYLTSPIDRRPKFHLYKPHIGLISGIAWDHINVFPTFKNYTEQFSIFMDTVMPNGYLVCCKEDEVLQQLARNARKDIHLINYSLPENHIENGITYLDWNQQKIPLQIFGKHNLLNLKGAWDVCSLIGVSDADFIKAIQSFKGASKRMELVGKTENMAIYKDFAHSPSKLKATIEALKEQYPQRKLLACIELHTFSSLTEEFLKQYNSCMDKADVAVVYFNPHTIEHKKLPPISEEQVKQAFNRIDLNVFTNSKLLSGFLQENLLPSTNLLMMSSGNYDGMNFSKWI